MADPVSSGTQTLCPARLVACPLQSGIAKGKQARAHAKQFKQLPPLARLYCLIISGMSLAMPVSAAETQGAGNVLRDLQAPALKLPGNDAPVIAPPQAPPAPQPGLAPAAGFRVQINSVKFSGASVFTQAQLSALLDDLIGKECNLAALEEMAERVTRHYRADGYILVRAYLPAQDIKNGQLEIAVLEGRYDAIKVVGTPAPQQANLPLNGLKPGAIIAEAPLERALLLLNDRPGALVSSTLQPGASVGTSELIIEIESGRLVSGGIEIDNYGSTSTGRNRIGGEVRINNPSGFGDLLTINGRYSGSGLQYGRIGYQIPVGGDGSKAGVALADVHYELGDSFANLNADGQARTLTLFGAHPLVRSRTRNLNVQLSVDNKRFNDRIDSTATVTEKASDALTLGLSGDLHDLVGGGGVSAFSASYTSGRLRINSAEAQATDDATAQTSGKFGKLNVSALRLQNLTTRFSLYGIYTGQWAFKNLDASEKMSLGGSSAVRAYAPGATPADSAHLLTLELRHAINAKFQFASFIDVGRATINKAPWVAAGTANTAILSGTGFQLTWSEADNFGGRLFYARKLGTDPTNPDGGDRSRFGVQIGRSF